MADVAKREIACPGLKLTTEELNSLLRRCDKGDEESLRSLRQLLATHAELGKAFELAQMVEEDWLNRMFGEKGFTARAFADAEMDRMRRDIGRADANGLERLLIERIIVCWLQLHYLESNCARDMGDRTWAAEAWCQKRLDRAHKRYLSAIKTLAQVRRLQIPVMQVNIGEKQVNVAGPVPVPDALPSASAEDSPE